MKTAEIKTSVQQIDGGSILTPAGFQAAGLHAGLRYSKKDLGAILSEVPASCAAVYTQSAVQAAPLLVTKESIQAEGKLQAVVVNSACANACTGEQGMMDARRMREAAAEKFGLPVQYTAVASTGVIGEYMKMDKILKGIDNLAPSSEQAAAGDFASSIMTTDTKTKTCCYQAVIGGRTVTMGGAAKGSGMIHPNMATMLGFITTDAAVDSAFLQQALSSVTDETFNQITVDGDTSTNDMVLVLANGKAGNKSLMPGEEGWDTFLELLKLTSEDLAKQIAADGEGAEKLIEVNVRGMESKEAARQMAKTIIGSNLVKTAACGADANWGRIIAAMGRSGAAFSPDETSISFGRIPVLKDGVPVLFSEEEAKKYLQNDFFEINVELKQGSESGTAWGCDLTYDYVRINASYRS